MRRKATGKDDEHKCINNNETNKDKKAYFAKKRRRSERGKAEDNGVVEQESEKSLVGNRE